MQTERGKRGRQALGSMIQDKEVTKEGPSELSLFSERRKSRFLCLVHIRKSVSPHSNQCLYSYSAKTVARNFIFPTWQFL